MTDHQDMKLFVVHLGYYDATTNFGVYESHTNVFVAARDAREAKQIAKAMPMYKDKKMHTDGIQEITAVQGYRICLEPDATLAAETQISSIAYQELNPESSSISGV